MDRRPYALAVSALHILVAVLGLSLLMIVHEGGHYLAARAFKMRVIRFSIGFGPTLARYRPKDSPTTFVVGAIPLLAYVQIAGMNPYEEVDEDDPGLFQHKSWFARLVTIAAGPVANYLFASLVLFAVAASVGKGHFEATTPTTAGMIEPGSPAASAGIEPGDVFLRADGKAIHSFEDLVAATTPKPGQPVAYVIERDGQVLPPITITPRDDAGVGHIGIAAAGSVTYVPVSIADAAKMALVEPYEMTVAQVKGIAGMVRSGNTEGVAGPVKVGAALASAVDHGPLSVLNLLIIISVALGFANLLPIPALDGGRLIFLVYELVTRRRPDAKVEAAVHMVGFVFLIGMLLLVTFRDIRDVFG